MKKETLLLIQRNKKNWKSYEKLSANKLDILGERNEFLETYHRLTLSHKEIDNLSGPITSMEIESLIKNLFKK